MRPLLALLALLAAPVAWADGAATPAATAPSGPVKLTLDGAHSLVYALVYKQGAASAVAHDHVVQARTVTGTGVWHPTDPAQCNVAINVKVADLFPDADSLRKEVGLPTPGPSPDQQQEILEHILADYQLYVAKYDAITFTSTSLSGTSGVVSANGNFTLHGVTHPIVVPMTITPNDDGSVHAVGKFSIQQSQYGFAAYSALFGALAVKDTVNIVVDLVFKPL